MINNKRLLWGLSAAVAIVAALAGFLVARRRRLANRTPTERAKAAAADALKSVQQGAEHAAHVIEDNAQQLAEASSRSLKAAREEINKHKPF